MKSYEIEDEKTKGNPMASMRFQYQTYTKEDDQPCESEWASTKVEAIEASKRWLRNNFKKFGRDDMVVKIFNTMNYKQKETIITLEDAQNEPD